MSYTLSIVLFYFIYLRICFTINPKVHLHCIPSFSIRTFTLFTLSTFLLLVLYFYFPHYILIFVILSSFICYPIQIDPTYFLLKTKIYVLNSPLTNLNLWFILENEYDLLNSSALIKLSALIDCLMIEIFLNLTLLIILQLLK